MSRVCGWTPLSVPTSSGMGAHYSGVAHPLTPQRRVNVVSWKRAGRYSGHRALVAHSMGPGSGHRKSPSILNQHIDNARASQQNFPGRTTKDCYEEFPFQVRASIPLHVDDHQPAGLTAQHVETEAPATGHRRRPEAAIEADVEIAEEPQAELQAALHIKHGEFALGCRQPSRLKHTSSPSARGFSKQSSLGSYVRNSRVT